MDLDKVADPPQIPRTAPANPAARLLPVLMLAAGVGMAVVYFRSGAAARGPTMLVFPLLMAVSVLGSLAHGARGTRRVAELDEARCRYLRHLDAVDAHAAAAAAAQHAESHAAHPEPDALWAVACGPRAWRRTAESADFCHVRVGVGARPPQNPLGAPATLTSEDVDPFSAEAAARLLAVRAAVPDVPVTVDLRAHRVITLGGTADQARALARAMVCQLAVAHHPDEVRIAAYVTDAAAWDWLKWLPHQGDSGGVHVVVVVEGPAGPVERAGVTLLRVGAADRPAIDVGAAPDRHDAMSSAAAVACAKRVAAIVRDSAVVRDTAWPALLGIDDPEAVDPVCAWRPRDARGRLRVPIGVDEAGVPVDLDLKEAAHGGMGPHGLCVGATGSGKSELLRTLVAGLVATHSPDALNLVLIDFKGGATFHGFEPLRHVAAVITNLADRTHLVARMKDALAGEMTRRQELLRAAGDFAGLADHDRARAAGVALPPLPVLLVVVDEFSELLAHQPDLAELFVAIGRVGRSLGMHLLLASQRLDEGRLRGLESHLSYRIALKTFSAAESRAVLGSAAAHDLPNTPGVALLQTADGDVVRFRACYASQPVTRRTPVVEAVRPFVRCGDAAPVASPRGTRSVLDAVLDGLAGHGRAAHVVWAPPLTASPHLGELLPPAASWRVPLGVVDDAFAQRRDVLMADLDGLGGNVAVVGGPRAGKSTAVRTLVTALAALHPPAGAQVYVLDFGGGGLRAVAELPHVGAVAGAADVELARRILTRVRSTVTDRTGSDRTESEHAPTDAPAARVFLVIDGWAAARAALDDLDDVVADVTRQGLAVGVHVVVAASRWADLRPALKDQLGTRIELRLGEPAESETDRAMARRLVGAPPGRGSTRNGLEFAIALPCNASRARALRHPGPGAPPVLPLPRRVAHATLPTDSAGIALGVGGDRLGVVVIDPADGAADRHVVVVGEPGSGKTAALRTLLRGIPPSAHVVVVDPRRTLLDAAAAQHLASADAARAAVADLVTELRTRLPGPEVTVDQLRARSWWSGPEAWLVVDDYDLVADAASGNPLASLLDLLAYARDVGLHVVLARRSGGAARAMFDPVLARLRDVGATAVVLSAAPDDGPLFGVRPVRRPPGRATLVRRGTADVVVQIAWAEPT